MVPGGSGAEPSTMWRCLSHLAGLAAPGTLGQRCEPDKSSWSTAPWLLLEPFEPAGCPMEWTSPTQHSTATSPACQRLPCLSKGPHGCPAVYGRAQDSPMSVPVPHLCSALKPPPASVLSTLVFDVEQPLTGLPASLGFCYKAPQTGGLKTTDIYSLTVQEASSPRPRLLGGGIRSGALPQLWGLRATLAPRLSL